MDKLLFKSYEDLIHDIKKNIDKLHQFQFDLIVGIPRSGMIPSYLISAFLNIDCCDVDSYIANKALQRGITRKTKGQLMFPHEAKKVLLLDDSIYSGDSLQLIKTKIPNHLLLNIITGAIYATGVGKHKVDVYFEALEGKKIFEWGIYHNAIIPQTCFDMDGVLCKDCTEEQNDDGEKYLDFINNVLPLFLPTGKIGAIVTNRLEKYRAATEEWLSVHGVEYDKLIMLDLPSKEERLKIDAGVSHKGKVYKEMKESVLFLESSLNQSLTIARVSGKPVYCVDENKFITPEFSAKLFNNASGLLKQKYYALKHRVKMILVRD